MRAWLDSLEPRERIMVLTAAVVVAFAVLYVGIWMPLDRGQSNAAESVENWKRSLAELRPLLGRLKASGDRTPVVVGQQQSLVVIVDTTLRERGLYASLKRSQPTTSNNGIRVEFENVAFDELVLWLGDLSTRYGLQVQSGSFSRNASGIEGRINSSLSLER